MEVGAQSAGGRVALRVTAAFVLAVFLQFVLPVIVSAAEPAVVINELMWDGTEYVELYNPGEETVDLNGWSLLRQQPDGDVKTIVQFSADDFIVAGDYWLLEKNEEATTVAADTIVSGLTLVNSGEQVTLKNEAGEVVDQANQLGAWFAGENTSAGVAMERGDPSGSGLEAASWHTSTGEAGGRDGTPGEANSEPHVNAAPEAALTGPSSGLVGETLSFSAEDSDDADGDDLTFAWAFGDGSSGNGTSVEHVYGAAGSFSVRLTVSDGEEEIEVAKNVGISAPVYSDALVINEFLPNPAGSDSELEFIELRNTAGETVILGGWQLDDEDGGSSPYTIANDTELAGGAIRSFSRADTKLALNNDGDTVRLLDPAGEVKSSYTYASSFEDQSYNRQDGGTYVLSTTVTPGEANVITLPEGDEDDEEDESSTRSSASSSGTVAGASVQEVALADVRDEETGTEVKTSGVVSVPPGTFGDKTLYLAGSGIQVYFSKGAFPELRLGDTVELVGTLSSIRGEARLKLAAADELAVVSGGEPPQPHVIETGDVDEAMEGSLVMIQGHVTSTSGDTFYIDDGSGEAKVYIKSTTAIDKPKMKKEMAVTITGVVSETTSGYRVLPRFQEDIRMGLVAGLTSFPATGEFSENERAAPPLFSLVWLPAGVLAFVWRQARLAKEPLALSYLSVEKLQKRAS